MENKFLSISKSFILFLTGLAIVSSIIMSIYSLVKFSSSTNEIVKEPVVESSQFFNELKDERIINKEKETKPTIDKNIIDTKKVEEKSKMDIATEETAKILFKNLNENANKILGLSSTEHYNLGGIENYLKNISKNIISISDENKAINFFNSLAVDSNKLVEYYELFENKKTKPEDYIQWYYLEYYNQIVAENQRIFEKKNQRDIDKIEAFTLITQAAIAFGIFIGLTIVLVLFKIELNTRRED